ncbi:hypothetical protein BDQ17DRAFT_1359195 [Cyathus striatus]|nr:hypothetical protein BDQ17DRAFT_1359195 [Cyathus striatus]
MPFPYEVEPPENPTEEDQKGAYIEKWLTDREAVHPGPVASSGENHLRKYYPKNRDQPLVLIGLSETGLRDCVPALDVGDAFSTIGAPTLSEEFDEEGNGQESDIPEAVAARKDLIDILSGHAMLMSDEGKEPAFGPWSLRYSGHQFGSWAGQLGDGRAISVLVTPNPKDPSETFELQLKGAGRTPFSRSADGLAVLRSSIREYLCSEAMQALGIPTTRSLSLILLPSLAVARERMETSCVMTRVAPSFIRIGSFEALNGPTNMFFFGGGQQKPDLEALRILGEWVSKQVLKLGLKDGESWSEKLILESARRNAEMVAGWQAYGFMHGVINTDNISILGLTIDYGPYAFMDVFDSYHICNHTDSEGRYAYLFQPNMIIYALRALLNALAPIVGAEVETGRAVGPGWAANASEEKIKEWTTKGLELKDELERVVQQTTANVYAKLMRKRLGLQTSNAKDESTLFSTLLNIMSSHKLDFHSTFRTLCCFTPTLINSESSEVDPQLHEFITQLLANTPEPERLDHGKATEEWLKWLDTYSKRIESEKNDWSNSEDVDEVRKLEMKAANPRFVLRQWVLEEVIKKVERDADSGKRVLAKVMQMASYPFEEWGAEGSDAVTKEEREERRYCGLGDKKLLGFQCSCSS